MADGAMKLFRAVFMSLTLLSGPGCASEAWDNPFDPQSDAYLQPCHGVTQAERETCVFNEDFSRGLSRWKVHTPAGMTPPQVRPSVLAGERQIEHVLALPGCKPYSHISIEFPVPAEIPLRLSVIWRLSENAETGDLGLAVDGAPFKPSSQSMPGALTGWRESVVQFPKGAYRTGARMSLQLWNDAELNFGCDQEVWIESVGVSR
jgi:hypothetical protein